MGHGKMPMLLFWTVQNVKGKVGNAETYFAGQMSRDRGTFIDYLQIEDIVQLERWELRSQSAHRAAHW